MEKLFCPYCSGSLVKKALDGQERLFCNQCRLPIYENPVPATAGVIRNPLGQILLVRRGVNPGKGKWCLPGGFLEIGESPEECVLRELQEETGLRGAVERFVGIEMSHNVLYESVLVAAYAIKETRGDPHAGDDATDVGFFDFHRLPEIAFDSHIRIIKKLGGTKKTFLTRLGAYVITSNDPLLMAEKAGQAGARILQYRDKLNSGRGQLAIARELRAITRKHRCLLIINDRVDMAMLVNADGAHLGQEDLPLNEARRLVPADFIIGVSTHSLEQAIKAESEGADYIGIGPVFKTPTKRAYPPIGLEVLQQVLERVKIPAVAIGGIDASNLPQLIALGVRNVAMVREFQHDPFAVVSQVNALVLTDGD